VVVSILLERGLKRGVDGTRPGMRHSADRSRGS
jgi:hypothetical protein